MYIIAAVILNDDARQIGSYVDEDVTETVGDRDAGAWATITATGGTPSARHDLTAIHVVGTNEGRVPNETLRYDTWAFITDTGGSPSARYVHTAILVESTNMFHGCCSLR